MAANVSNTPWPFKRVRVEESPLEYVARMQSGIMEPPTKLVPDEEAIKMPAELFIRPDQIDWKAKIRHEEVVRGRRRTTWRWRQDT